jgi:hypothetical protein
MLFLEDLELQLTTWIGMERPNHTWEVISDQDITAGNILELFEKAGYDGMN